jgi:hypothetical protein
LLKFAAFFDRAFGAGHGGLLVGEAFGLDAVARADGGVESERAGQRETPDDPVGPVADLAAERVGRPGVFAEQRIEEGESPADAGIFLRR